jgi:GNAT superfamily N-acetyltransferase
MDAYASVDEPMLEGYTTLGYLAGRTDRMTLGLLVTGVMYRYCEHLFGPSPSAEVLIAEVDGSAAGFALFFQTHSTFLTRPGLWLEDLFVRPEHRRGGVGKALLAGVAQVAAHRGCGRVEWSVLDWNKPSIAFYQRLGARLMDEWTTCRVEGKTLAALARGAGHPVVDLRFDSSEVESQEMGYQPRAVVDRLAPGGRPARRAR